MSNVLKDSIVKLLRQNWPYIFIALIVSLLVTFLLRNVGNFNYPLSGEFLTSPFHSDILSRSLNVWDEHFGLGFSNLLSSSGEAPYAGAYSGAMWVSNNVLNALFQYIAGAYYINQTASLLLLTFGVYFILKEFRPNSRNIVVAVLLSVVIVVIIQSTDFFTENAGSAGRFVAGQGLMLIAFLKIRRLSCVEFRDIYSAANLIPLALVLSTLLLVSAYFLALGLMIGIHCVFEFARSAGKRSRVVINYVKVLAIFVALICIVYGYVIAPPFFSAGNGMMSGMVGRHDSPMQLSLISLLRFYNNPAHNIFGWFGIWLQFGLALLGIIWAMLSSGMRRWAIIDLLVILIFLFLAKGSAPPLADINHWLHVNIPFLRMMGSGYPYLGVIYTLLIYYLIFGVCSSLDAIEKRLPRAGGYAGFALVAVVLVVAVSRNDAYLSGDFGGRVQSIEYPAEYYEFKKVAERDMQLGRAYYFPDEGAQIGWDYKFSPTHPLGCCFGLPFSSVFPVDINWSNFNKNSGYYGQTMDYLMHHFHGGDEIARILSDADTKYVVFDLSLKQTSLAAERMLAIRNQVRTSQSFEFRPTLSNRYLEVYENKQWHPFSSKTHGVTLGTDDPGVFLEAARSAVKLSMDSIVVSGAITLPDALGLKANHILKNVLLYNNDERGLMLDMIRAQYEIRPNANFLGSDGLSWYTYGQVNQIPHVEAYGGRFVGRYTIAAASAGAKIFYRAKLLPNAPSRLLIRALVSPNSGKVRVDVDGENRLLNLHSSGYAGLQWFDLGEVVSTKGKVDIKIEALDAGQPGVIDVLSVVPEKQLSESSEMMRNLLTGVHLDRIEKTDYLQWKKAYAAGGLNMALAQNNIQIKPKRIIMSHQHFKFYEDFDLFGEGAEADDINLIEQESEVNSPLGRSTEDRNFLNNHINNRYLASADTSAGIYSLKYELSACQPFSELTLSLHTAYVSAELPLTIYASDNASAWTKIATRTSDNEGAQILDLGGFAKGKKKIYLKISYAKLKNSPDTVYLTDLVIRGVAGQENMSCELPAAVGSKDRFHLQASKSDVGFLASKMKAGPSLKDEGAEKNIVVINKAFDPNWQMDGVRPFNINYGFAAFLTAKDKPLQTSIHGWQDTYRILWLCSLGFYLFLWLALIWHAFRRECHDATC